MVRDDEAFDDELPRRKKRGGFKGGFWSLQRIAFVAIFIGGLILGYYFAAQIEGMNIGSSQNSELQKINQQLDALNDKYYSCLQTFEIDPNTCRK